MSDAPEALRLAQHEASLRRDVFTLDALAWALHANRRTREARQTLEEALKVGVKDPRLLRHARIIGAAGTQRIARLKPTPAAPPR